MYMYLTQIYLQKKTVLWDGITDEQLNRNLMIFLLREHNAVTNINDFGFIVHLYPDPD